MTEKTDEPALIREAREGSMPAFMGLVQLHQGRLRAYLLRYIRDMEAVDDLAQETLLAALRDITSYRETSLFSTWVIGIARHRVLTFLRDESLRRSKEQNSLQAALLRWRAERAQGPEGEPGVHECELSALRECLKGLPQASARLVTRHYVDGRRLGELARECGRTEGALKMLFLRIRAALRECLDRRLRTTEAMP